MCTVSAYKLWTLDHMSRYLLNACNNMYRCQFSWIKNLQLEGRSLSLFLKSNRCFLNPIFLHRSKVYALYGLAVFCAVKFIVSHRLYIGVFLLVSRGRVLLPILHNLCTSVTWLRGWRMHKKKLMPVERISGVIFYGEMRRGS